MFKQPNAYTSELEVQGDGGGSCVAVAEVSVGDISSGKWEHVRQPVRAVPTGLAVAASPL